MAELKIKLVKSKIGVIDKHKKTLESLGLTKINSEVIRPDNEAVRGQVDQVNYLVEVEEV